jgi:ornithine carbamoyltransferase
MHQMMRTKQSLNFTYQRKHNMNTISKTLTALAFVLGAASANAAPTFNAESGPSLFDGSSNRARAEVISELAQAKAAGQVSYGERGPVEIKTTAAPVARADVIKEVLDTVVMRAQEQRLQRG